MSLEANCSASIHPDNMPGTFYTIGHSTRPLTELVDMLSSNGIKQLVDVRTIPKSRTNPQASFCMCPGVL
jgi:hypothetical protein